MNKYERQLLAVYHNDKGAAMTALSAVFSDTVIAPSDAVVKVFGVEYPTAELEEFMAACGDNAPRLDDFYGYLRQQTLERIGRDCARGVYKRVLPNSVKAHRFFAMSSAAVNRPKVKAKEQNSVLYRKMSEALVEAAVNGDSGNS